MPSIKRKVLVLIALLVVAFIAGIIFSPFLRETTYQLKNWVGKPSPLPPVSKTVILYFSTPEGELLSPVERKIPVKKEINDEIRMVIGELIKGPKTRSLFPTVPPETKIRAVYTKGDTIYVDFSPSIVKNHPGGTSGELITIYSIVNTLLENFPSYSKVQILVGGETINTLAGHIDIRGPFKKNPEMIEQSKILNR